MTKDAFAELMKYLGQDETTVPPLGSEPADEGAEEAPTEADCWGAQLTGAHLKVLAWFVLGKGHFKNKFCHACRRNGLAVPAARVRTVLSNCNLRNELRPGFWSGPSLKQNVVGSFRLINQTADCIGSPLLLTSDESAYPATSTYLDVVPSDIVDANNYVNLIVSKGTLVPVSRERMAANALARSGSGESAASSSPSKGSAAGKRTQAQLDVELEEDQRRKSPATIDEKEGAAGLHERVSLGGATAGSSVDSRASAAMTSSLDIALALREASTLHGAGGFVPLESRHRDLARLLLLLPRRLLLVPTPTRAPPRAATRRPGTHAAHLLPTALLSRLLGQRPGHRLPHRSLHHLISATLHFTSVLRPATATGCTASAAAWNASRCFPSP